MSPLVGTILLLVFIALVVLVISRSIRIVPQATAGIVERFGRYHRTLNAGLNMVTPFVDRLRPLIDLREQVVSFPAPSRTRWRSRCAPTGTSAPRSCPPRGPSSRPS
jgi:regulator of protease activity HflC (stomatin/prohibitin superfamily)